MIVEFVRDVYDHKLKCVRVPAIYLALLNFMERELVFSNILRPRAYSRKTTTRRERANSASARQLSMLRRTL